MEPKPVAIQKTVNRSAEPHVAGRWACALAEFLGDNAFRFDPEKRYPFSSISPVWARIREVRGTEAGIRFGRSLTPAVAPELYRTMLLSETLGDALYVLADTLDQLSEAGRLVLLVQPDQGMWIHYLPWSTSLIHLDLQIEAALSCVLHVCHWLAETEVRPLSVSFMHRTTPDHLQRLVSVFKCPVHAGDADNTIHLAPETLSLRVQGPGQIPLGKMVEDSPPPATSAFVHQVERIILACSLTQGRASRARVAAEAGVSERTLLRRLAQEGETFQSVHDRVMTMRITELLRRTPLGLEKLALLTGYADSAAFSRGVQRLLGTTPVAFRKSEQVY